MAVHDFDVFPSRDMIPRQRPTALDIPVPSAHRRRLSTREACPTVVPEKDAPSTGERRANGRRALRALRHLLKLWVDSFVQGPPGVTNSRMAWSTQKQEAMPRSRFVPIHALSNNDPRGPRDKPQRRVLRGSLSSSIRGRLRRGSSSIGVGK